MDQQTPTRDEAIVIFNMYRCIHPDGSEIELPRPIHCACNMNHERLVLEPCENHTPYKEAYTFFFTCPVTGIGRVIGFGSSSRV